MKSNIIKTVAFIYIIFLLVGFLFGEKIIFTGLKINYFFFFINNIFLIISLIGAFLFIPLYPIYLIIDIIISALSAGVLLNSFGINAIYFNLIILLFKSIFWFLLLLNSFYELKYFTNKFSFLFKKLHILKKNMNKYFKKMFLINIFLSIFLLFEILINKFLLIKVAYYLLM